MSFLLVSAMTRHTLEESSKFASDALTETAQHVANFTRHVASYVCDLRADNIMNYYSINDCTFDVMRSFANCYIK